MKKHGFAGLRLEHVAARAGVSKGSIYRRWRSREALALDLVLELAAPYRDVSDVGDTRSELVTAMLKPMRGIAETDYGHVLRALLSRIAIDPVFQQAFRSSLVKARRDQVARVVDRGIARGDLLAATDAEKVTELLVGAVLYRLILGGKLDRAYAESVVDALLRGYAKPKRRRPRAVRERRRGRRRSPTGV